MGDSVIARPILFTVTAVGLIDSKMQRSLPPSTAFSWHWWFPVATPSLVSTTNSAVQICKTAVMEKKLVFFYFSRNGGRGESRHHKKGGRRPAGACKNEAARWAAMVSGWRLHRFKLSVTRGKRSSSASPSLTHTHAHTTSTHGTVKSRPRKTAANRVPVECHAVVA